MMLWLSITGAMFLWIAVDYTSGQGVVFQDIRLACGNSTAGRVEVKVNGVWGTVCDDIWTNKHASVVCRQLGLQGGIATVAAQPFGRGWGTIWMDDVNCVGNETALNNCSFITTPNCNHEEDAGVMCQPADVTVTSSPFTTTTQLSTDSKPYCGVILTACEYNRDAIELTEWRTSQGTTCQDFGSNQQIEWAVRKNGVETVVASCISLSASCTILNTSIVATVSRSSTSSFIVFALNATRPGTGNAVFSLSGYDVICRPVGSSRRACPVDITYAPSYSNISCSMAAIMRWNITVSCTVSKAYSSLGRYNCDVRQRNLPEISQGRSRYSSGSSSDYVSGTCITTFPMPASPGVYFYNVYIYPGVLQISVSGSVTVAQPSHPPGIRCNNNEVTLEENKPLTCTCFAGDLGQPEGRLLVYRNNAPIVSGNYGNGSVPFGVKAVSISDNKAVFRCVLDWATADGQDNYTTFTLNVAFSPRLPEGTPGIPNYLNCTKGSVSREIPLTANPPIQRWTLDFYGHGHNITQGRPAHEGLYKVQCPTPYPSHPQLVTCVLTITAATEDDEGIYLLVLDNGVWPPFSFLFELDVNGEESQPPEGQISDNQPTSGILVPAVAVGVTSAVFIISILVLVIWMWRRQWVLPCATTTGKHERENGRSAREVTGIGEEQPRSVPVSTNQSQASPYESLQVGQSGCHSQYSSLGELNKNRVVHVEEHLYVNTAFAANSP